MSSSPPPAWHTSLHLLLEQECTNRRHEILKARIISFAKTLWGEKRSPNNVCDVVFYPHNGRMMAYIVTYNMSGVRYKCYPLNGEDDTEEAAMLDLYEKWRKAFGNQPWNTPPPVSGGAGAQARQREGDSGSGDSADAEGEADEEYAAELAAKEAADPMET